MQIQHNILQYLLSNIATKKKLVKYFEKKPEVSEAISDIFENYNNYLISYHNLGPDIDYGRALLIYERVNLAGKRLSALYVAEAV